MKKTRPAPELHDILRLREANESKFAGARKKWESTAALYFGDYEIPRVQVDDDDQIIRTPYNVHLNRAAEIQDSFTGLVNVTPKHSVLAPDLGSERMEGLEDIERFANAYRQQISSEQGEDLDSAVTWEAGLFGFTGVKTIPDLSAWKDYPKQGKDEDGDAYEDGEDDVVYNKRVDEWQQLAPFPVQVSHIRGLEWLPELDGHRVYRSLEVKNVSPVYVESRYCNYLSQEESDWIKSLKPSETLEMLEYCDDTWCGWYLYQGIAGDDQGRGAQLRDPWRHRMPLPEGQAPAWLGRGLTTTHPDIEKKYLGLLDPIAEVLKGMDFLASRQATMVLAYFWLSVIVKHKLTGDSAAKRTSGALKRMRKFVFGGTTHIADDESLDVLGPPANLPDLEGLWNRFEERTKMHWPPALQGILEGKSSGYLYRLVRDTSLTKVQPRSNLLAQLDADIFRGVCYAIGGCEQLMPPAKRKEFKVYIRAPEPGTKFVKPIGLSWSMVRNLLTLVRAERAADMPVDTHANLDAVGKAIELKMPPARAWQQYGGVEDPEQMADEWDVYEAEQSDPVKERVFQEIFEKMDLLQQEEEAEPMEELEGDPNAPPGYGAPLEGELMEGEIPPDALSGMPEEIVGMPPMDQSGLIDPATGLPMRMGTLGPPVRAGTAIAPGTGIPPV